MIIDFMTVSPGSPKGLRYKFDGVAQGFRLRA